MSVNHRLYFILNLGDDAELWTSLGTTRTVSRVEEIFPGVGGSDPPHLTRVDDRVFFTALTANEGRELWVSNGSEAGTHLVQYIRAGAAASDPDGPNAHDGKLYFT